MQNTSQPPRTAQHSPTRKRVSPSRQRTALKQPFAKLRARAAERNIEFSLSFRDFVALAERTGYTLGRGRGQDALSIDRINPWRGYTLSNIQVITNRQNLARHFAPIPRRLRAAYAAVYDAVYNTTKE